MRKKVLKVDPQGNVETVVELDDDQPSGLGWLPNGDLLIVAMTKKQVLRFNGSQLSVHADLSSLASHFCNDMVVDHVGRAYVGNFGFDIHNGAQQSAAELICVEVDGSARCVDDDLIFPNGAVITPDNKTLIVAETFASRLTAFDILDSGDLTNKRIWAQLPKGAVPDGICLDAGGGIWSASPTSNNCIRQIEGGEVTHTIELEARRLCVHDWRSQSLYTHFNSFYASGLQGQPRCPHRSLPSAISRRRITLNQLIPLTAR